MTAELDGRELRERVARIMGWTTFEEDGTTCWVAPDETREAFEAWRSAPPAYPSHAGACKLVKDWLREQGIEFDVKYRRKEGGDTHVWVTTAGKSVDVVLGNVAKGLASHTETVASTEELAVCRFVVALKEAGEL